MFLYIATVCCGIFAGAALFVSAVQHPAAIEAGEGLAARFFPPMYRRAATMQASLAVVGSVAAILAWLVGEGFSTLLGGLLLGSSVPVTLILIKPINDRLLANDLDPISGEASELLGEWARLHRIRSATSALGFLCLLGAA